MKNDHADDFASAILKEDDDDETKGDLSSERVLSRRVRGTETTERTEGDSEEDY